MSTRLRLILAVITSLLDEAIIIAVILWVLPMFGIRLPLVWLIVIIIGFVIFAVTTFILGTHALSMKPVTGFTSMIGSTGKACNILDPEGFVKIKGELWHSSAESGEIDEGSDVIVVGQKRLKLIVRRGTAGAPDATC